MTMTELKAAVHARHGFLTMELLATLAANEANRLKPVLVRCGGCRFTCPAQDAAHLIAIVDGSKDYVRDVSLPVGVDIQTEAAR